MKGGAPLARLLPMARAALTELGPKEETGRRRVCVLQEDLPETTLESFESSARSLAQFCKAFGWEVVLLSCWGYDGGGRPGVTAFSDAAVLKAHRRVARELGAVVAPAGYAHRRRARSPRPSHDIAGQLRRQFANWQSPFQRNGSLYTFQGFVSDRWHCRSVTMSHSSKERSHSPES
mmetsp:Transcript_7137/g.21534  ORF Transcript_7137/g.21534 Transcript_7137/m.21534 type:complete len:177 (-) Transcript_7137:372-902(-)